MKPAACRWCGRVFVSTRLRNAHRPSCPDRIVPQYDAIPPPPLCGCGCGQEVSTLQNGVWAQWKRGHHWKRGALA